MSDVMVPTGVILIKGPRRSGRTTALIAWAAESPGSRCVVVRQEAFARMLRQQHDAQFPIIGFDRYTQNYLFMSKKREFGIDDYDETLWSSKDRLWLITYSRIGAATVVSDRVENIPYAAQRVVPFEDMIADLREMEEELRAS